MQQPLAGARTSWVLPDPFNVVHTAPGPMRFQVFPPVLPGLPPPILLRQDPSFHGDRGGHLPDLLDSMRVKVKSTWNQVPAVRRCWREIRTGLIHQAFLYSHIYRAPFEGINMQNFGNYF
jgi:hypothetical protein